MSARGGGAGPSAPRGATETKTAETKTTTPLELHRFPDWRALRGFALREAEGATPDRSVALIVPTEGAAWVLERFLRSELPLGAVAPFVATAARAFGDLLDDARDDARDEAPRDAPAGAAPASRLMRETVLEEALAAGAEGGGAPPGAPELLAEPLLAFLDEQAADRSPTPGEEEAAAFEAFCDRVEPVFSEESETDRGAARLAASTGWLRGVVRRYRNGLRERGRLDPEGVRRELVRQAESVRAARRWARVVALGEGALAPADAEVFAALAPPEGLAWALPPGAPTPGLPPSLRPIDRATDRESGGAAGDGPASKRVGDRVGERAGDRVRERPGSPFAPAAPAERRTVFAPEPAADSTPEAPDSPARWVFVVTDRDDEMECAVRLLDTFRDEGPTRFRGFDRCAIAAQKPALYLPAAESAFAGAGIPFRTPEAAPLVAEPWAAGLGDLLDFAERPEQLSRGLTLLRNPFLTAPGLPAPPPLSADRAERAFLRGVPTVRPRAAADPGEPALFRVGLRDTLTVPAGRPAAGASEAASSSDPAPAGSDPVHPRASDSGSDDSAPPGGIADSLRALAGRFRKAVPVGGSTPGTGGKKDSARKMAESEDDAAAAAVLERLADWADDLAPFRDPGGDLGEAVSAVVEFVRARFSPEVPEGAEDRASTDPDAASGPRESEEESALFALVQAADSLSGVRSGSRNRVADLLRRLLRRRKAPRRRADEGVQLVRAEDAPFGDFDGLVVLGLSDADWPGPRPSNIFYPRALLEPATRERHADRRAAEVRLLRAFADLPRRTAAFVRAAHEDGFPAGVSPFEVELREALEKSGARRRTLAPPAADRVPRRGNGPLPAPAPLPAALDRRAPSARALERTLSPSALDRYADSPAEFFARNVLYLDEERQLSDIAPPTERGLLLHEVLERGIPRLHEAGIAVETAPERALDLLDDTLREIARRWQLPTDDLRSERLWLFGHAAEPGALEWFLREQAAQGPFEPRNYEKELVAEIEPATAAALPLKIAGRADRVDTLPDGRLRVLEYKSGRFFSKPLQARLYARLLEAGGSVDPVYGIAYLGDRRWVGPGDKPSDSDQDETIRAIRDGLAAGDFGRPRNEPTFGMPLVSRHDLPEAAPDGSDEPGAPDPGPGVR